MKTYIITEQDIENLKYSVSDIDRFAVDRWQETLKVHSNLDLEKFSNQVDEILNSAIKEDLTEWLNNNRKIESR